MVTVLAYARHVFPPCNYRTMKPTAAGLGSKGSKRTLFTAPNERLLELFVRRAFGPVPFGHVRFIE